MFCAIKRFNSFTYYIGEVTFIERSRNKSRKNVKTKYKNLWVSPGAPKQKYNHTSASLKRKTRRHNYTTIPKFTRYNSNLIEINLISQCQFHIPKILSAWLSMKQVCHPAPNPNQINYILGWREVNGHVDLHKIIIICQMMISKQHFGLV